LRDGLYLRHAVQAQAAQQQEEQVLGQHQHNRVAAASSSSSPFADIQAKLAQLEALSLARLQTRRHQQQQQQALHPHIPSQRMTDDPPPQAHLHHLTQARQNEAQRTASTLPQVLPARALTLDQGPANREWQGQDGFQGGDAVAALTVHASPQQLAARAHQQQVHDPLLEGYSRLLSSCAGLESAVHKMWTNESASITWDDQRGGVLVEEKRLPAWQQALVAPQVGTKCADVPQLVLR
jgi:hypothetical protein